MKATQFFEYLRDHPATHSLAEELALVLAPRNRRQVVPVKVEDRGTRRIAS